MKTKVFFMFLIIYSYTISAEPYWKFIDSKYFTTNDVTMTINCIDSCDCIAASAFSTSLCKLLRTTDAGRTWNMLYDESNTPPYPNPYYFVNMKYISKTNLFIMYRDGYIKHSKNLGKSWDTIKISGPYNIGQGLKYFSMCDSLTGMACDVFGYYITDDGWKTRKFIKDSLGSITGCWMHSIDTFAILRLKPLSSKPGGSIYSRTSDRGKTWVHDSIDDSSYLQNIFFLNRQYGWLAALEENGVGDQNFDVIFKTSDGGETWKLIYKKENEPIFGLQDIAFGDYNNGVAVGQYGKILRTTDGGLSWFQEKLEHNPYISQDIPLSMNVAYAGNNPIIGTWGNGLYRLENYSTNVTDFTTNDNSVNTFPNPFEDEFTISINKLNSFVDKIELIDILGNIIDCTNYVSSDNNIKIKPKQKLKTGMYFYKICTGFDIYTGKIIKR